MKEKYRTFSGRLTRRVMLTVFVTMILIASIIIGATFHVLKEETEARYQGVMDLVSEKLGRIFLHEEICARNVFDEVCQNLDSPESVMKAMEREIKLNDYTQGYYMGFEPGYFPQYPKWFEPYMGIRDEKPRDIGSETHDYLSRAWYNRAKTEKNGFWTEPYYDDIGANTNVCSFCLPLYDSKGRLAGVCGSDMTLNWLMSQVKEINASSINNSVMDDYLDVDASFRTFIITRKGTYVYHPDENRILKDNIRSHIDVEDLEDVEDMLRLNRSQAIMTIDGVQYLVYYAPLKSVNWVMGIAVPRTTTLIPALVMIGLLFLILIIGLIVIYLFCRSTIRQISNPLTALAKSADEVAKGNFNAPLPVIAYKDELCQLRDSFATMQNSLYRYMKDLEQTTTLKTAIENELKIAYDIQMSMIPRKFPPYPKRHDIDIYGHLTPAKSVGGDLFDFHIRDEHLFFCIGDVSGKGVPAALLMTVAKNLFHTISLQLNSPAEIMSRMNNAMSDGNDANMFVTLFIGVLDLKTGHLDYCNGGHDAPVILSSDAAYLDAKPNILVGLMGHMPYVGGEMEMAPGTTILLYTDGLTEAMNKGGELYSPQRLLDYTKELTMQDGLSALQLVNCLFDSVRHFADGAEQSDDLTMLAIRYLGPDQNNE